VSRNAEAFRYPRVKTRLEGLSDSDRGFFIGFLSSATQTAHFCCVFIGLITLQPLILNHQIVDQRGLFLTLVYLQELYFY
jgi:hypothetical protein